MGSAGNGPFDYYADGDYNAICSMCGHKFKASMLRRHWQGQWRCENCWEPRQPQDFVKATPDVQTPPWTQVDEDGTYLAACSFPQTLAIAGLGVAGCVVAGRTVPNLADYVSAIPFSIPLPSISAPLDGATVSGVSVFITITSTNLGNVDYGYIQVDGVTVDASVTNGTYSWDSTSVTDGDHTITFTVVDLHGVPHLASINVTVANVTTISTSFYTITV